MKRVLVLFAAMMLLFSFAGMAEETGYIVGHVNCKVSTPEISPDGMPGMDEDQFNEFEIEIACVKDDYSQTLVKARTDKNGYFYLADQPLYGLYRVTSIQRTDFSPISIIVPSPDPGSDAMGRVFTFFSSRHEANAPIIDIGETIVELVMADPEKEAVTQIIVEREYGNEKAVFDTRKEKPFDRIEGQYGYPGIEYYASSGPKDLQHVAQQALEDRRQFNKAKYLKEEADQLRENDKETAMVKYREAVQAYSAYLDAYDSLIGLLADMELKEEAVFTLEEAMQNCPSSDGLYVYCRMAAQYYMAAGDAKKAISHYEKYLSLRSDNSWAIVHLAKAYIADSRFEDAYNAVNQGNKSVIYYAIYSDFEKANHISEAKEMLRKAISTYSDGSLSKSLEEIEEKLAGLEGNLRE